MTKKKEERRAANAWQQKTIKINLRSYQETVYKNKPPHVRLYVFVSLYKNKLIKTTNEIYIETKSSMKYGRSCSGKMNKNKFYLWPHFVYAISENFESKTTKKRAPSCVLVPKVLHYHNEILGPASSNADSGSKENPTVEIILLLLLRTDVNWLAVNMGGNNCILVWK